ncbi:MAG: hypothetical protein IAF02_07020 [Anaerolineae bacterium]|nr:hypothetical protein [Anaerolineae bacterium]
MATDDEHYEKIGIQKSQPEAWEDGMRTDGQEGSYEWWYVDSEFEDGTTIVTVFYTKDGFDVPGPAQPTVYIDITYPDGTVVHEGFSEEAGNVIDASTEIADVQIGESYLRDIGGAYELKFASGDVVYEAIMETTIPMWRPATGHWFFGDDEENFFAWVVAQPSSNIQATLTVGDTTTELTGTGYHDHNWGNIGMNEVMNHWYWGRAKVGEYDVITADIISEEAYGYTRVPVIMVAKDGEVIADNQENLVVERADTIQHPETGKFMDNHITYILADDDDTEYRIEYIREEDIVVASLLESLPAGQKFLANLLGANPTYVRILGDVILTVTEGENVTKIEQEGLWEQMFFGNNTEAYIWN